MDGFCRRVASRSLVAEMSAAEDSVQAVQLDCPLCCNESFTSHDALKYHLLSIVDNLLCPVCGQRYEKLHELAEHIGKVTL